MAIRDVLAIVTILVVDVYLSNIHLREAFLSTSLTVAIVTGLIADFGAKSYEMVRKVLF